MKLYFNLQEKDYIEINQPLNYSDYKKTQSSNKRLWPAFKSKFESEKHFRKIQKEINRELRTSEKQERNTREDAEMQKYLQGSLTRKPKKEKSFPPFIVLDYYDIINNIAYYRYDYENKRN